MEGTQALIDIVRYSVRVKIFPSPYYLSNDVLNISRITGVVRGSVSLCKLNYLNVTRVVLIIENIKVENS